MKHSPIIWTTHFLAALILAQCTHTNGERIDSATVTRYIHAMKGIRDFSPELSNQLRTERGAIIARGVDEHVADVIENAGFHDLMHFSRTHDMIASAYRTIRSERFTDEMTKNAARGLDQVDAYLRDPRIPPAVKEKLKAARDRASSVNTENEARVRDISKKMHDTADPGALEAVRNHMGELEEIFEVKKPGPASK